MFLNSKLWKDNFPVDYLKPESQKSVETYQWRVVWTSFSESKSFQILESCFSCFFPGHFQKSHKKPPWNLKRPATWGWAAGQVGSWETGATRGPPGGRNIGFGWVSMGGADMTALLQGAATLRLTLCLFEVHLASQSTWICKLFWPQLAICLLLGLVQDCCVDVLYVAFFVESKLKHHRIIVPWKTTTKIAVHPAWSHQLKTIWTICQTGNQSKISSVSQGFPAIHVWERHILDQPLLTKTKMQ